MDRKWLELVAFLVAAVLLAPLIAIMRGADRRRVVFVFLFVVFVTVVFGAAAVLLGILFPGTLLPIAAILAALAAAGAVWLTLRPHR